MLHEQLADETKASPILGQGGLLIVLDLNDLPACAPDYENVRCIPMLRSFMTVFESEGLFLPRVGMRCGHEDLKRLDLILRFRMARAAAYDVRDFALHARFRAADWIPHSAQLIEPNGFAGILAREENQVAATRFFKRGRHTISKQPGARTLLLVWDYIILQEEVWHRKNYCVNIKRIVVSCKRTPSALMPDIYEEVGKQIRELRTALRGRGISQEELALAVKTTANTISRWETATYKPSISDLERLAQFFGVPITIFFPQAQPKSRANAVLSATADLDDDDLEEVMLYAQFRKAHHRGKRRR